MKNKKAVGHSVVISIIILIIVMLAIFFITKEFIASSLSYMSKEGRHNDMIDCLRMSQDSDFGGMVDIEDRLYDPTYNRDQDDYIDSCDICVGYNEGSGEDGHNKNDRDNDYIPDDCDSEPDNPNDELICNNYLKTYNNQEQEWEFIGRCATQNYCAFLIDTQGQTGWGDQTLKCFSEK
jgi:hypothetical protein